MSLNKLYNDLLVKKNYHSSDRVLELVKHLEKNFQDIILDEVRVKLNRNEFPDGICLMIGYHQLDKTGMEILDAIMSQCTEKTINETCYYGGIKWICSFVRDIKTFSIMLYFNTTNE